MNNKMEAMWKENEMLRNMNFEKEQEVTTLTL